MIAQGTDKQHHLSIATGSADNIPAAQVPDKSEETYQEGLVITANPIASPKPSPV